MSQYCLSLQERCMFSSYDLTRGLEVSKYNLISRERMKKKVRQHFEVLRTLNI